LKNKYLIPKNRIVVIEYGANVNNDECDDKILKKYNLTINNFYLIVARLEPENNIETIVSGFMDSNSEKKLVVVGDKLKTNYCDKLMKNQDERIKFVGGIYNKYELLNIRKGCFAYFHGHSVGGTNPSLLEAMAAGNYIIAHDNIFNREVTDNLVAYFSVAEDIKTIIESFEKQSEYEIKKTKELMLKRINNYYNWDRITNKYINFFDTIGVIE